VDGTEEGPDDGFDVVGLVEGFDVVGLVDGAPVVGAPVVGEEVVGVAVDGLNVVCIYIVGEDVVLIIILLFNPNASYGRPSPNAIIIIRRTNQADKHDQNTITVLNDFSPLLGCCFCVDGGGDSSSILLSLTMIGRRRLVVRYLFVFFLLWNTI